MEMCHEGGQSYSRPGPGFCPPPPPEACPWVKPPHQHAGL